jgi:threonine aldolase
LPPINLYSDTQTRPSDGMRAAIASAVVGDEQRGHDPTTRELEERVAALLGHEAAVFLPSGTMCNAIALRLHARPGGDEVLLDHTAHSINFEAGGPAELGGLRTHVDGARLMNAVVASGVSAASFASGFDTAWIDFTKGLGAPVGAVLAGSRELIDEAWRWKHLLGGALRQSGIVAAGCLYALDHHVERLAEDHANARVLAQGLVSMRGVRLDPATVETNIVIFCVDDAPGLVARLADRVELQVVDAGRVRAVTHLDVSRADVERALEAVADELESG